MKILTKHYVILNNWATDGFGDTDVLAVLHTLEEAKEKFKELSKTYKTMAENNNWEVLRDSDICFDAGEEDFYDEEHVYLIIREV